MPARKRSMRSTSNTEPNTNTNQNVTKESNKMALTPDQITELLADNRGRGDYATYLKEFIDSGVPGQEVETESGILAGKTVEKVKTGLENAKKARNAEGALKLPEASTVLIIRKGDSVFVINRGVTEGS